MKSPTHRPYGAEAPCVGSGQPRARYFWGITRVYRNADLIRPITTDEASAHRDRRPVRIFGLRFDQFLTFAITGIQLLRIRYHRGCPSAADRGFDGPCEFIFAERRRERMCPI